MAWRSQFEHRSGFEAGSKAPSLTLQKDFHYLRYKRENRNAISSPYTVDLGPLQRFVVTTTSDYMSGPILASAENQPPLSVAAKKRRAINKRLPPHEFQLHLRPELAQALSADKQSVETVKIQEIISILWLPASFSMEERDAKLIKAFDLLKSIRPADGLETMLALQMIGAHEAALVCLEMAKRLDLPDASRSRAMSDAQKMMSLYLKQVTALNKRRGHEKKK